ncbi:hypothetical protein SAMN06265365_1131, partial [Tistlia consotensis]
MSQMKLSVIFELADRFTAPVRRIQSQIDRLTEPVRRVNGALGRFGEAAGLGRVSAALGGITERARGLAGALGQVGGRLALLSGGSALGGLFLFKSQFLDTATEFESFRAVLETIEGSSEKAKVAMDWVSDFAAKTPF